VQGGGRSMRVWRDVSGFLPPSVAMSAAGTCIAVLDCSRLVTYAVGGSWAERDIVDAASFAGYTASLSSWRAPAMSPNGRWIVAPMADCVFGVWDCSAKRMVARLIGPNRSASGCAVNDAGLIVTTSENQELSMYKLPWPVVHSERSQPYAVPVAEGVPEFSNLRQTDLSNSDAQSREGSLSAISEILPLESAAPSTSEKSCCIVCLEAPISSALKPCWHASYCIDCATEVFGRGMSCSVCRSPVEGVQRIYIP
jgi:Zinc finger, C3HC4 type (RING finger)